MFFVLNIFFMLPPVVQTSEIVQISPPIESLESGFDLNFLEKQTLCLKTYAEFPSVNELSFEDYNAGAVQKQTDALVKYLELYKKP